MNSKYTVRLQDVPQEFEDVYTTDEVTVENADSPIHAVCISPGLPSYPNVEFSVTSEGTSYPITDGDLMLYLDYRMEQENADPLGLVGIFGSFSSRNDRVSSKIANAVVTEHDGCWVQYGDRYYLPSIDEVIPSKRLLADALLGLRNSEEDAYSIKAKVTAYAVVELPQSDLITELKTTKQDIGHDSLWIDTGQKPDEMERVYLGVFHDVNSARIIGQRKNELCIQIEIEYTTRVFFDYGRENGTEFVRETVKGELTRTLQNGYDSRAERIVLDEYSIEPYGIAELPDYIDLDK